MTDGNPGREGGTAGREAGFSADDLCELAIHLMEALVLTVAAQEGGGKLSVGQAVLVAQDIDHALRQLEDYTGQELRGPAQAVAPLDAKLAEILARMRRGARTAPDVTAGGHERAGQQEEER